jgi:hypothetical protein
LVGLQYICLMFFLFIGSMIASSAFMVVLCWGCNLILKSVRISDWVAILSFVGASVLLYFLAIDSGVPQGNTMKFIANLSLGVLGMIASLISTTYFIRPPRIWWKMVLASSQFIYGVLFIFWCITTVLFTNSSLWK